LAAFYLQLDVTGDFFCHVAFIFGISVPLAAKLPKSNDKRRTLYLGTQR
jgi:hypothetical protein